MKFLVILAAFNGEKYIKEQIDTILKQDGVDVNLKIFDDGSNDSTMEILSSCKVENMEIFINSKPSGSAANNFFNALQSFSDIFLESFDFIAFADQDDVWMVNKLKVAGQLIESEGAQLYFSNMILWDEKENKKTLITKSSPQKKYDYLFEGGSAGCTYVFTNKLGKDIKKSLEKTNYNNWPFFSHDWFVYFFARMNKYKVVIDKNAYILYRIHETNVHGKLNKSSFFAVKERLKLIIDGWYFKQANGFKNLLNPNSVEYRIYKLYSKNYFSRFYIIFRYNFLLIRNTNKAFLFFIVSLLPLRVKK